MLHIAAIDHDKSAGGSPDLGRDRRICSIFFIVHTIYYPTF